MLGYQTKSLCIKTLDVHYLIDSVSRQTDEPAEGIIWALKFWHTSRVKIKRKLKPYSIEHWVFMVDKYELV